ncbi:MAG: hypothetical protein IH589_20600 [Anaerolineales bacterium]|nr:hypothetical protein [Anaerolineales bacterium]
MDFHVGDPVMHWTHGFGQVVRLEEQALSGSNSLYYAVQVRDLTVWVPADDKLDSRLRPPTTASGFRHLIAILSSPGKPLPEDRFIRRTYLLDLLKDGRAESLCQIIRDLTASQKIKALNDNDQVLLKQSRAALVGEWGFVRSITPAQAEMELHRALAAETLEIEK